MNNNTYHAQSCRAALNALLQAVASDSPDAVNAALRYAVYYRRQAENSAHTNAERGVVDGIDEMVLRVQNALRFEFAPASIGVAHARGN